MAWIVTRKDFSEFRANRQILLTLTVMPVVLAVFMPLLLALPATLLNLEEGAPPDLGLGVLTALPPGNYTAQTLVNTSLNGGRVESSVVNASRIENATLVGVLVEGSLLINVTIESGLVRHSVILNSTVYAAVGLEDTYVSGDDPATAELREVFAALALNTPLLFFVIMSVAVPTTLAAYSFVGEKANRTLEPLLATPLTDGELLLGKYLSALVPTMVVLLSSFVIFTVLADLLVLPQLGLPPLPNLTWIVDVFVLMPLFSFLGISLNVLISTKVSDVRAAQQYGALLVMPLVFIFAIPSGGLVVLGVEFLLILAAIVGVADIGVFLLTRAWFGREEILTRWK